MLVKKTCILVAFILERKKYNFSLTKCVWQNLKVIKKSPASLSWQHFDNEIQIMRGKRIQIVVTKIFFFKKHEPFCSQRQFQLTYSFLVLRTHKLKKETFDFKLVHFIPRDNPIEVFINKFKFGIIWVKPNRIQIN